jgi:hypothetical protein
MLEAFELERLKDQRFYSEKVKGFVTIAGTRFTFNNRTIDLKKVSVLDTETQDLISDILYETKTKYRLEKETIGSGKNKKYLMGKNQYGEKVWLETPSWDCSWYWGFGYLTSKNSLTHVDGLTGRHEYYDTEKQCHRLSSDYIHNIYDSPKLVETTFTLNEGWKLSELFKEFYLLKDMAEYTHRSPASCNLTTSPVIQDPEKMAQWYKEINEVMIPLITAEILRMLTPEEEVKK